MGGGDRLSKLRRRLFKEMSKPFANRIPRALVLNHDLHADFLRDFKSRTTVARFLKHGE